MYAVVEDSGRQFMVQPGDAIEVELRNLPEGADRIEFGRVLMLGEGKDSKIGTPLVPDARVEALIDDHVKAPKIDVIKFKRRKGYRRKQGHRQSLLRVTISKIVDGEKSWSADLAQGGQADSTESKATESE
jgi:large subunit ribosomal protein L21